MTNACHRGVTAASRRVVGWGGPRRTPEIQPATPPRPGRRPQRRRRRTIPRPGHADLKRQEDHGRLHQRQTRTHTRLDNHRPDDRRSRDPVHLCAWRRSLLAEDVHSACGDKKDGDRRERRFGGHQRFGSASEWHRISRAKRDRVGQRHIEVIPRPRLPALPRQLVNGLGHEVIARKIHVSEVWEATARENPDVALVGLGDKRRASTPT